MRSRSVLASIAATMAFSAPAIALFLCDREAFSDVGSSWQRGFFVFPIVFLSLLALCPVVAKSLIRRGFVALPRFALGASFLSASVALLASVPAATVGIYINLFSLQTAVL